jgi:glucose-1-phosphate cytidylyltransferase
MKVILLAGGFGTRLMEETVARPKPMVEIGGIPILVHIMQHYAAFGMRDFVVACGYRGDFIKDYFCNYPLKHADWHLNLRTGERHVVRSAAPDWNVWAIDTGLTTMTGGRIGRLRDHVGNETFLATYGDGLADIDISDLVAFHRRHGRLATVTAVHPPARFGCLDLDGDRVRAFAEKPQASEGWINGGYFVFEPDVFDLFTDDATVLEREPMERLVRDGQLQAYRHTGFWHPMDTIRDRQYLENLWNNGAAPWQHGRLHHDAWRVLSESAGAGDGPDRVQGPLARKLA